MIERKRSIIEMITKDSSVSVASLAQELGVSVVTIRADFDALEKDGVIVRTRGGALPAFHPKIIEQMGYNKECKSKIAQAAAGMIEDGDSVIISSGTTTALIGKYLLGRKDIHIVTNNTLLLTYARVNPQLRVTLIGGEFRPSDESVVGPLALRELENFHVSKVFIGTDGVSLKQGFTANLLEGAEFVRKIAEQADTVYALADSEKFGKPGFVKILPFDGVDYLICDSGISAEFENELNSAGVKIVKA
jgi:DeoR family transcriptional regulator, galactitol utilization operon repressor